MNCPQCDRQVYGKSCVCGWVPRRSSVADTDASGPAMASCKYCGDHLPWPSAKSAIQDGNRIIGRTVNNDGVTCRDCFEKRADARDEAQYNEWQEARMAGLKKAMQKGKEANSRQAQDDLGDVFERYDAALRG